MSNASSNAFDCWHPLSTPAMWYKTHPNTYSIRLLLQEPLQWHIDGPACRQERFVNALLYSDRRYPSRLGTQTLHVWHWRSHVNPFAWCNFSGQKFSFDFYNPMVVQKCIATTQALLNDRDVASCIMFAMFWLDRIMIMEHKLSMVDMLQNLLPQSAKNHTCFFVWGSGRWCWCWEDGLYHDSVPWLIGAMKKP